MRLLRVAVWAGLCALVVLGARSIAYALTPGPQAVALEHRLSGPTLPVVAATSLLLALAIAALLVWLAWTAVRERHLLSGEDSAPPPLDLRRLAITAPGLFVGSCLLFTALESYIHKRSGMGVHGPACLLGPVHRDAIPILAALALLAAAIETALRHLLAWARRTIQLLGGRALRLPRRTPLPSPPPATALLSRLSARSLGARGPPAVAFV